MILKREKRGRKKGKEAKDKVKRKIRLLPALFVDRYGAWLS